MLCPRCGYYSENEESVCPSCGELLKHESGFKEQGAQAIRQGKRAREAARSRPATKEEKKKEIHRRRSGPSHAAVETTQVADTRESMEKDPFESYRVAEEAEQDDDPEHIFERRRRTVYTDETDPAQAERYLASLTSNKGHRHNMVNWMKVMMISFIILVVLTAGTWIVLNYTDWGEKLQVRAYLAYPNLKIRVNSASLWAVGEEMMDEGRIQDAIDCFEHAKAQDTEAGSIDVDGLLMLGNAYEAAGRTEDAAALYEYIYTETPSRTEAYVAHIRILENSGDGQDLLKASELMKKAYENTDESSFLSQRSDLLPAPPEVNPIAGYYETKRTITLTSYQGYDIYYTKDDNAKLPYEGTKYEKPFPLDEGTHNLRAVAVNGTLVSDELKGTYKIIMPSPQAPQCNLAPNTYKTKQSVKLRPGKDNINDDDIVIYYTIDGSEPNSDSPVFNGDPIQLANGYVVLQAVAVNHYGKVSHPLVVKYKINANPKPKAAFTNDDTLDKIRPGVTTQLEFQETYGEGTAMGTVESEDFTTECRRYDYPWGYAIMNLARKTWVVVEVCVLQPGVISAPRGTGIGQAETEITGQFKDMLQVEGASGSRGLYSNDHGTGKIHVLEDKTRVIRYRYTYDGHWLQLEYRLNAQRTVDSIDIQYIP